MYKTLGHSHFNAQVSCQVSKQILLPSFMQPTIDDNDQFYNERNASI